MAPPTISDNDAAILAETFHLLGDPTRLRIVIACLAGPVSVGEIAERAGASPSLASHHLRLLKAARIVGAERRGKQVFYAAADDHIRTVLGDMIEHVAEDSPGDATGNDS
jgi:DNA-binding transcriptional ArsR family regulator